MSAERNCPEKSLDQYEKWFCEECEKGSEKRSETCPKIFEPLSRCLKISHRHFSKRFLTVQNLHKNVFFFFFSARLCRGRHAKLWWCFLQQKNGQVCFFLFHRVFQGGAPRGRQLYFTCTSAPDPLFEVSKPPFLTWRVATPLGAPPDKHCLTLRGNSSRFRRRFKKIASDCSCDTVVHSAQNLKMQSLAAASHCGIKNKQCPEPPKIQIRHWKLSVVHPTLFMSDWVSPRK